ncbi:BglG family transcription antiterminator [Salinibacillus xinjiangensis]|uniref:PRD domain-containing protein n=1 Tax=Salinibacillus xinjiangensis TaxID=1229268 RepID=A0A6G1X228_9BACI|nr:BglG family transcription antiterminator [Salinibacillus xinjiangensis]MRG84945.1 PRD domain-containing protein [Salinibacillus xinjiangensis]
MSLDKRSTAILMQLIHADSYLSIKELTERLNVSRRTIYYDIDKINHWLESQRLDKIEQVRSAGLILTDETKDRIPDKLGEMHAWHYEYSASERKAWIAIYIMASEEKLHLESLMEKVRVSRNTTIEDIKALKEDIQKFGLDLEFDRKLGYTMLGEETDIRKAIVYYLSLAIPEQNWQSLLAKIQMHVNSLNKGEETQLFDISLLKTLYNIISESEKELNIQFTDDVLHSMSLRLVLFGKRIKQGHIVRVDTVEKEVLSETKAFQAAQYISRRMEKNYHFPVPEEEQFYLTTHLLGARINYSSDDLLNESLSDSLREVAEKMVNDFQKYACLLFQNRELLIKNLLIHLKPAYYRIKYGLEVENQLLDAVKAKYEEVFMITKKVVHHFEQMVGKSLHENEIAFIAMHLGGWMRKEGATTSERKKALVVCATGVGTSQILKQQLEGLFSTIDITETVSVREYEEGSFDVDLVISTTPVTKKDHPVFVVNPILTDAEKEGLLKKVNLLYNHSTSQALSIDGLMDIIERHADIRDRNKLYEELKHYVKRPEVTLNEHYKPSLTELIKADMIQIQKSVRDWKEAITLAAQPLLQNGFITKHYIEAMIKNVEQFGPYIVIAPKFAIPHAKPEDGVRKLGMSLLRLDEQVSFSKDSKHDVHFLVVLAAMDNETHLKALSQLTQLFSNSEEVKKLKKATSTKEMLKMINHSISKTA